MSEPFMWNGMPVEPMDEDAMKRMWSAVRTHRQGWNRLEIAATEIERLRAELAAKEAECERLRGESKRFRPAPKVLCFRCEWPIEDGDYETDIDAIWHTACHAALNPEAAE